MAKRAEFTLGEEDNMLSPKGHADYDARIDDLGLREYIAEVDEQGFAVIPPEKVATPEFIERVRNTVLRIAEARTGNQFALDQNPAGSGAYHSEPQNAGQFILYYLLFEDRIFEEWLNNPTMRAMVDHYMRGEGQLSSLTCFVKWKGGDYGDTLGLHSDTPRPLSGRLPETGYDVVNSALCLTDYTNKDGAIAFVPGSHKLCRLPEPGEMVDQAVAVEAAAGSLIFFNGNVWHGAFPKQTDGLRLTITTYICHQRLKTQEQYQWRIPREMLERNDAEFAKLLGAADTMGWREEGPQFSKFAGWMENPKDVPQEVLELHQ
ncbi:MAG: phytanoyl-CoA dioxygenase family protein [Pseudomonadota bacterium]|nr:phytanoyl-CoA dioxygenase family protein [Pseudomonadota bacterium]